MLRQPTRKDMAPATRRHSVRDITNRSVRRRGNLFAWLNIYTSYHKRSTKGTRNVTRNQGSHASKHVGKSAMTNRDPQSVEGLTLLKENERNYPTSPNDAKLEAFENAHPDRDYWVELDCPEFTSMCPITGQPDFGHLVIRYIPDKQCVESKSLKLYLFSYRNCGAFHEDVTNRILDDLIAAIAPRRAIVRGSFRPRGGIAINVEACYPSS
jgi:7-cyano-7-deazaguanine reductase